MDSFEDVGVSPELVESLAAAGIERPTSVQEVTIPVVRRGNNLVIVAGPGSGTLVAWGAGLLERLSTDGATPKAIVVTPTSGTASRLAESLGLLAVATEHTVAALGAPWALPSRAHVLFGTPGDLLAAVERSEMQTEACEAVVVTEAAAIAELHGLDALEAVLEGVPSEAQRIVLSLPLTPPVLDFVKRHVRRSTTVPPQPSESAEDAAPPHRGELEYLIAPGDPEVAALASVERLLEGDARHVLLFCRSEDRAADMGDWLTLHGYLAGAPGDGSAPVWLGVDALEARAAAQEHEGVCVVSLDVPADPDALDRRHGIAGGGVVIVLPRELEHLKRTAAVAGYTLEPRAAASVEATGTVERLRESLRRVIAEEDVTPYLALLEPLFAEHDPAVVAAAATALARRRPAEAAGATETTAVERSRGTPAWVRLFVTVGERDGLRTGDLLGAITGEANVEGGTVGRIEIRESHSLVEVHDGVARTVIDALNGTTIKGRAVRVDYDRQKRGVGSGGRRRPPRDR